MSRNKTPGVSGKTGIPDKYDMSAEELIGLRTETESGFGASAVRDEIMGALCKAYKPGCERGFGSALGGE